MLVLSICSAMRRQATASNGGRWRGLLLSAAPLTRRRANRACSAGTRSRPNFLKIGLRFLKQDHGRFAVFSAVIRELDGGFQRFVLRRKNAFQLLGLHYPLVFPLEYDELDECRSSGGHTGRLHPLSPR